ncbi:Uma2 family endonuclease [Leptolyngbya sp. AN02str]|uniref:Uma2 family endonuclease n=1 Tax=Leptolyngbya sp. AN02str TaxID=3423363 RepID=UPI003D31C350
MIMTPVGDESGNREASLLGRVWFWNENSQLGFVFSSSTIFKLPNGTQRSPDVAWISTPRWEALTPEQRKKFPPIAPDFVIELCPETDDLQPLQAKMQEYIDSGVKLGWLINPQDQQVEIYRLGQLVAAWPLPSELSGEPVMPGFVLKRQFWLRAFLRFSRRENLRKAHFCVRNAHAKMGTSAYP